MDNEQARHPEGRRAYLAVTVSLWAISAVVYLSWILRMQASNAWLLDWNEHWYSAVQLLDQTLYRLPMVVPGVPIPIDYFNFPPFAAVWIVPLLSLGREGSGLVFVVASGFCIGAGLLLATRALRLPVIAAPIVLLVYLAFWNQVPFDIALGNLNPLIFLLVAAFAVAHLEGRQRTAGILLGLAIAIKIWPIALVVLLLRERRWREIGWAAGIVLVTTLPLVAWLGFDLTDMVRAIIDGNAPAGPVNVVVLWTTAFRQWWDWWPAWGTYAVAAALLLIPAKGRLGLGLGIIAGLSLKAYIWHHYIFAFGLGWAFVGWSVARQLAVRRPALRRRGEDAVNVKAPHAAS